MRQLEAFILIIFRNTCFFLVANGLSCNNGNDCENRFCNSENLCGKSNFKI